MNTGKKLGMVVMAVVVMLVTVPVGAAVMAAPSSTNDVASTSAHGTGTGDVFDIFTMSPEQLINAFNGTGGAVNTGAE